MTKRAAIPTFIRVSKTVSDEIGALAAADHVTHDEALHRLARAERQRRIGAGLAAHETTDIERAVIKAGLATVGVRRSGDMMTIRSTSWRGVAPDSSNEQLPSQ